MHKQMDERNCHCLLLFVFCLFVIVVVVVVVMMVIWTEGGNHSVVCFPATIQVV